MKQTGRRAIWAQPVEESVSVEMKPGLVTGGGKPGAQGGVCEICQ